MRWDKIVEALGGIGGFIWGAFGGRDTMLIVMLCLMAIDYLTGLLTAAMGKSLKTEGGRLSSAVCWAGLIKKCGEMIAVVVGVLLDKVAIDQLGMGTAMFRTGIMLYIVVTEAISVLENLGVMGVPLPEFVLKSLEQLHDKAETGNHN